jgi:hypothetical protein
VEEQQLQGPIGGLFAFSACFQIDSNLLKWRLFSLQTPYQEEDGYRKRYSVNTVCIDLSTMTHGLMSV